MNHSKAELTHWAVGHFSLQSDMDIASCKWMHHIKPWLACVLVHFKIQCLLKQRFAENHAASVSAWNRQTVLQGVILMDLFTFSAHFHEISPSKTACNVFRSAYRREQSRAKRARKEEKAFLRSSKPALGWGVKEGGREAERGHFGLRRREGRGQTGG